LSKVSCLHGRFIADVERESNASKLRHAAVRACAAERFAMQRHLLLRRRRRCERKRGVEPEDRAIRARPDDGEALATDDEIADAIARHFEARARCRAAARELDAGYRRMRRAAPSRIAGCR
jgi:hypothetical protein